MLENLLKEKNLPPFKASEEMLDILLKEEYGYMPSKPEGITYKSIENYIPNFCAGKATLSKNNPKVNLSQLLKRIKDKCVLLRLEKQTKQICRTLISVLKNLPYTMTSAP